MKYIVIKVPDQMHEDYQELVKHGYRDIIEDCVCEILDEAFSGMQEELDKELEGKESAIAAHQAELKKTIGDREIKKLLRKDLEEKHRQAIEAMKKRQAATTNGGQNDDEDDEDEDE